MNLIIVLFTLFAVALAGTSSSSKYNHISGHFATKYDVHCKPTLLILSVSTGTESNIPARLTLRNNKDLQRVPATISIYIFKDFDTKQRDVTVLAGPHCKKTKKYCCGVFGTEITLKNNVGAVVYKFDFEESKKCDRFAAKFTRVCAKIAKIGK
jgi:hypothetical protein